MTKKRSLNFRHCSLQWSVDNACIVVRDTDNYLMCCSEDYMCVQHDHFFHDFAVWTREALKPCPIDAFIHLAHRNSISIRRESGKKPVNCVSITDTEYTDRRRPRAISKEAVDVVLQQTCMYTSHVTISDRDRRRQSSNPTILFKPHPFDRHPAHPSNHRPSRDSRFPLCRREESSCGGKNVGRRLFGACGRSYTGGVRADVAEAGARRDQLSGL
jgi:hypothetical protein